MANVLATALFVIGVIVMLTSLLVWTAYMLPRPVARAQRQLEARPWQSFFLGIIVLAVAAGCYVAALTLRHPFREFLLVQLDELYKLCRVNRYVAGDAQNIANEVMYVALIPFLIALIIGASSFAKAFANRVDTSAQRPAVSLLAGAFLYSTAIFLPLIGWFVFLPIVGLMSAGAGMLGLLTREQAAPLNS